MKLWIVGAYGFVGSTLFHLAKKKGYDVVGTSHQECDATDIEALRKQAQAIAPTHIINCVAFVNVDAAEKEQEKTFLLNRDVPFFLATVAKEQGARLIHISTDYVFGGQERATPYVETDPCSPVNVYGRSKWEGELFVQKVLPKACIVRTSWIFAREGRNFFHAFLQKMKTEKEVEAVQDQIGKSTYCPDLASALLELLNHEGIVHFSNDGIGSRYDAIMTLWKLANKKGIPLACEKIIPVLKEKYIGAAIRPSYSVLDTVLYTKMTGHTPRSYVEAFEECLS